MDGCGAVSPQFVVICAGLIYLFFRSSIFLLHLIRLLISVSVREDFLKWVLSVGKAPRTSCSVGDGI